jgi:hypothetical protein
MVALENSKRIGGLIGPAAVGILVSESPLIQPHLYEAQIPPVVYLSGVLLFIAGLAIVRAHNVWVRNWTVLITIVGWFGLVLGLVRMFAAGQYRAVTHDTSATTFIVFEAVLLIVSLVITFKAYSPDRS